MKVKELQAILAACDQDSVVLIAGFETTASLYVAEADLVIPCNSVSKSGGQCPETATFRLRVSHLSGLVGTTITVQKHF